MIYYIDSEKGSMTDGTSPDKPLCTHRELHLLPGDAVLFRRGTVIREHLRMQSGVQGQYIRYGAYGEGDAPIFRYSESLSNRADWTEIKPNIWKHRTATTTEPGNLIFDRESCGTLRWDEESLQSQGDWYDNRFGDTKAKRKREVISLLLYSVGNPMDHYNSIEAACYGDIHRIATCADWVICEDLHFENSGVHAIRGPAAHMIIRRCSFSKIGGCVWSESQKIRLGNAIEFWNIAVDVLVEDCCFDDIYDSCVTHQGNTQCQVAKGITIRNCLFRRYGMAAYEGRDLMSIQGSFCNNTCVEASSGFAGQGDLVPRRSEIYPMPMGHHLYFWRMERPTEGGSFKIANNYFGSAPQGAALFSLICKAAEAQLEIHGNRYHMDSSLLLAYLGERGYAPQQWDSYVAETTFGCQECKSNISDKDAIRAWYHVHS